MQAVLAGASFSYVPISGSAVSGSNAGATSGRRKLLQASSAACTVPSLTVQLTATNAYDGSPYTDLTGFSATYEGASMPLQSNGDGTATGLISSHPCPSFITDAVSQSCAAVQEGAVAMALSDLCQQSDSLSDSDATLCGYMYVGISNLCTGSLTSGSRRKLLVEGGALAATLEEEYGTTAREVPFPITFAGMSVPWSQHLHVKMNREKTPLEHTCC